MKNYDINNMMHISDEELIKIKRASLILSKIIKADFEVFLYGSRVKGTSKFDSDFDIAIKFSLPCDEISKIWKYFDDTINFYFKNNTALDTHVEFIEDENGYVSIGVKEASFKIYP